MATEVTHDVKLTNLEVTDTALCGDLRFKRNIITVTGVVDTDVARQLLESESGSIIAVNQAAQVTGGDNVQITLPLAGDDTSATTATVGLFYEIHVVGTPGDAGALLEISTGDDAVNFAAYSYFIGAHASADGVSLVGTRAHSKLILTPATPAESLDTIIRCTCMSTTLWRIECFEPAAAATNFTTAAAAAFA